MVSAPAVALRPPAVPAVSAPTRLRLPDLLHATDRGADDVLSGHYDHLLPAGGPPARPTAGSPACTATTSSTSG